MSNLPASSRSMALRKPSSFGSHKVGGELARKAQALFEVELVASTEPPSLLAWAFAYMQTKVIGIQANNTEQAKRRDLTSFLDFYGSLNGHLNIKHWLSRDTRLHEGS